MKFEMRLFMATWVTISKASMELEKSRQSIMRLLASGLVKIQRSPDDHRVTLVDLDELRRLFAIRQRARAAEPHDE
jgi:hypothetical protein